MTTQFSTRALALFLGLLTVLLTTQVAFAHESRDIGPYRFTVGFSTEPPIEGEKNGVSLRVIEGATQQPVEGVEKTLKVEVTHVPTEVTKTFDLRTIFRDPGNYTTDLIPTASGHYRFRFFGTVGGREVNETFDSRTGGGNFDDVQPAAALMFPQANAQPREIEGAVRGAQTSAQQAQQQIGSLNTMSIAGLALGILGTVSGIGAWVVALRKR